MVQPVSQGFHLTAQWRKWQLRSVYSSGWHRQAFQSGLESDRYGKLHDKSDWLQRSGSDIYVHFRYYGWHPDGIHGCIFHFPDNPDRGYRHIVSRSVQVTDDSMGMYKIITYIDSIGCMSCKLGLLQWQDFAVNVDSIFPNTVHFQFVFQPYKLNEIRSLNPRSRAAHLASFYNRSLPPLF